MFFTAAAILFILAFSDLSQQAVDIAIGNTYVVIGLKQICWSLSIYFALLGFGLRHLQKVERPIKLIWQLAYWSLSVLLIFVVAWIMYQFAHLPQSTRVDESQYKYMLFLNKVLSVAVVAFLITQLGFVAMLVWWGFKKK